MKQINKTFIAASLIAMFGVAHAESSVTLYGGLNVAVTKKGSAGIVLKPQEYRYASHIGFTGKEDLGAGYSAIFKLEGEIEPDTGSGTYGATKNVFGFNRNSYVGLVTPYGAFRFGRSTTPFTNMWIGGNFAEGRGIGEFTGGLAGSGLRTTQPEVAARWNNALFYDIKKGGLTAGLAVTTKGSQSLVPTRAENLVLQTSIKSPSGTVLVPAGTVIAPATTSVDNEGASGAKAAYGAYARYEGKSGMLGYRLGAAYQVDNGGSYTSITNAPAEAKSAWLLGAGLSYGPVSFNAGYATAKIDNTDNTLALASSPLRTGKSKTIFAGIGYDVTKNDHMYASYGKYKRTNNFLFGGSTAISGEGNLSGTQVSLGYEHSLSKRTVIYANARKVFAVKNECTSSTTVPTAAGVTYLKAVAGGMAGCGVTKEVVNSVLDKESGYSYDIGISHKF